MTNKTRLMCLSEIGLSRFNLQKNILIVGLFTPDKNQEYAIELARHVLVGIQFHFVGNMAENFKSYWEPLMQNQRRRLPNCHFHGEKDNIDEWYPAMDMLLSMAIIGIMRM